MKYKSLRSDNNYKFNPFLYMQNDINQALQVLKNGGLILYPTDTVWGIGCDATNAEAVEKVFQLKERKDNKALICLVSDDRMLFASNHPQSLN